MAIPLRERPGLRDVRSSFPGYGSNSGLAAISEESAPRGRRLHRLLRRQAPEGSWQSSSAAVEVPPSAFRQIEVITRLNIGERLDAMHTVLLVLPHRCVIGTLEPEIYHRIGHGRVLNPAA